MSAETQSMELMVVQTAITRMDKLSAGLKDLQNRFGGVVYDVRTSKGMADAKAARREIAGPRIEVEKVRKEAKAPILELGRKLDAEAKRITEALTKVEDPIAQQIQNEENRIEAERQAKIDAELRRVAELEERIAELRGNQMLTPMSGSKLIAEHLSDLEALPVDGSFGDRLQQAIDAKASGRARLTQLLEAALANEKEAARLLAERAEIDRQRAEQAAREKAERDKRDAEIASENRRLADERRAFEAMQAAERAKIAAENARIAADQAAAQKLIDDQRREMEARQKIERDAQAKRDREAKEAAERAERENFHPGFDAIVHIVATTYQVSRDKVLTWIQPVPLEG